MEKLLLLKISVLGTVIQCTDVHSGSTLLKKRFLFIYIKIIIIKKECTRAGSVVGTTCLGSHKSRSL